MGHLGNREYTFIKKYFLVVYGIYKKISFCFVIMAVVLKMPDIAGQWWRTPLIPAMGGRGRRISEFEASLVCRVSSADMMVHTFSPSTQEAEAGGFLSLRPTWCTE